MLLAIPILVILNALCAYYAFILYKRSYEKYISFEPPMPLSKAKAGLIANAIAGLILFPLGPFFIIKSNFIDKETFFLALCGYFIGYLGMSISRAIYSIIVIKYIENNPKTVTGNATFKIEATRIVNIGITLQSTFLLGLIALFSPSPFILGAVAGLAFMAITLKFSKTQTPAA